MKKAESLCCLGEEGQEDTKASWENKEEGARVLELGEAGRQSDGAPAVTDIICSGPFSGWISINAGCVEGLMR